MLHFLLQGMELPFDRHVHVGHVAATFDDLAT